MLVKIKKKALDLNISTGKVGSEQDLPVAIAEKLIAYGRADKIEPPKKKAEPKEQDPEVQTAVVKSASKRPVTKKK